MRALCVIASSISPSISHEAFFSAKRRAAKRRFACSNGAQRGRFIYLSDFAVETRESSLHSQTSASSSKFEGFRENCERERESRHRGECSPLCGRVSRSSRLDGGRFVRLKGNSKSSMYFGNFLDARTSARMAPRHHPRSGKLEEV